VRTFHLRIATLLLALTFFPNLQAQVTGSISGKVEDSSGASVSGADVIVKSLETGAIRKTSTEENGSFTVVALPLGAQEVRVEKKGFKPAIRRCRICTEWKYERGPKG